MDKNIQQLLLTPNKEYEKMSIRERQDYLKKLREYCYSLNMNKVGISITQRLANKFAPLLRNYDYSIIGQENVPRDGCILMCNHSNSHDALTTLEVLTRIGLPTTFLAGEEGLSPFERFLYDKSGTITINRGDKESTINGMCDFSSKLLYGDTGVVFGEGTWNLHPVKAMQDMKIGGVKIASITNKPIVPVIYEYVEVPDVCDKEKDMYSKCIIKFGRPITLSEEKTFVEQTKEIQKIMEDMRKELWQEVGTYREKIEDINPELYINHTWLKKFGTNIFEFNSEEENKFLYSKDGKAVENEYCIDEDGVFKPGIIKKSYVKK